MERAELLLKREQLELRIGKLRAEIKAQCVALENFLRTVMSNPAGLELTNAPGDLGSRPYFPKSEEALDWQRIPTKDSIARLVKDLIFEQVELDKIKRQLQGSEAAQAFAQGE